MYTLPKPGKGTTAATGEADQGSYIRLEAGIVAAMEKGPEAFQAAIKQYRDIMDAVQGSIGGFMGQVVPLREMERMVEIANPLGLIGCICRKAMLGLEEYPSGGYLHGNGGRYAEMGALAGEVQGRRPLGGLSKGQRNGSAIWIKEDLSTVS